MPHVSHGILRPRDRHDEARAERRNHVILTEGRPVLGKTQNQRDKLLNQFEEWLGSRSISLTEFLDPQICDIDTVNALVDRYGRELFASGRPYGHYSETINAITGKKPRLKRCMQEAWNLAYAWLREEPPVHHVALPWQLLLSLLAVSLLWGWHFEAGILALSWGSLARAGEVMGAKRQDLILPSDVGHTVSDVLLQIHEPKTRFRVARHQVARLDQPQLVMIVILAFADLPPHANLWPMSQQTMRSRFQKLLKSVGLEGPARGSFRGIDMGSLRAGGASWLLSVSEDSELVRRRGRWISSKVMEIYVQEVASIQFLHKVDKSTRDRILAGTAVFPLLLDLVCKYYTAGIPRVAWQSLLAGPALLNA